MSWASAYVRVPIPKDLIFGILTEREIKVRSSRQVLIWDACHSYEKGKFVYILIDTERMPPEHEDSDLRAKERELEQSLSSQPLERTLQAPWS